MIAIVSPNFDSNDDTRTYLNQFSENLPKNRHVKYLLTSEARSNRNQYENIELISIPFSGNSSAWLSKLFWTLKARKILMQLYRQNKIHHVNLNDAGLMIDLLIPKCVSRI